MERISPERPAALVEACRQALPTLMAFCAFAVGVAVGVAGGAAVGVAQDRPTGGSRPADEANLTEAFTEETNVVAIDRMIGLEGTAGWLRGGKLPRKLEPSDFAAWGVGGESDAEDRIELMPVALETVVRGLPEREEPWTVVVLLDAQLASTRTVRWAVGLLADHAEELTKLGRVTVWLSSGEDREGVPKTLLLPTEETAAVKELLSRLALLTEGEDSVLQHRWDWLEAGEDEARAERAAQDEVLTLRTALDARLLRLTEVGRGTGPRRLLLWVTDGFDLSPERFYGVGAEDVEAAGELDESNALRRHFRDVIRALSADGWIAVPLRPPDQDPYRGRARGVRIGKWRFLGIPPFFVWGTYEAERDPEKSEALLELGDARLAEGDVEGAADAYGRAYHHFYGDPETGDRQAVALLHMSDCLEILGDRAGARKARGLAAELDPAAAARHLATQPAEEPKPDVARLLDPLESLQLLAEATSGGLVAEEAELAKRLFELERRLRLTLQLPPHVDEGLYRVEIRWRGEPTRTPAWVRAGEAPAVDAATIRRGDR